MRRLVHVRTGPRRKVQHNRPTGPQSDKFTFNSHCATVQAKTDLIPNNKSFVKKKKIQCERRLAPVIVPGLTSMCVQTILRGSCLVSKARRARLSSSASGVDCRGSARTLAAAPLRHSVKTPHPREASTETRCSGRRAVSCRFPESGWSLVGPSAAEELAAGLCARPSPLSPRG